jgi:hypothetical protein
MAFAGVPPNEGFGVDLRTPEYFPEDSPSPRLAIRKKPLPSSLHIPLSTMVRRIG